MHQKKASLKFMESCYTLYEQKMYQIAYGILRDAQLAEDAVQNVCYVIEKPDINDHDTQTEYTELYESISHLPPPNIIPLSNVWL